MNKLMIYIAFFAGFLFILFGLAFLFTDVISPEIPNQFKIVIGVVFILYGIYRIVMTIYKKRRADEENI